MNKLSPKRLAEFVAKSNEMIKLKEKSIVLYKEIIDEVLYEHSEYDINTYKKGGCKLTYVLQDKERNWLKDGTFKEIIKYIKDRNIDINTIFIAKNSTEFKKELEKLL